MSARAIGVLCARHPSGLLAERVLWAYRCKVKSRRAQQLLLVLAALADTQGRIYAGAEVLAQTAELSVQEYSVFLRMLKNRGFIGYDFVWDPGLVTGQGFLFLQFENNEQRDL